MFKEKVTKKYRKFIKNNFPKSFYKDEFPFQRLGDRPATDDWEFLIPNHLYQTWEDKMFGRNHFRSLQAFRDLNPDMNFHLLDKQERDAYMIENWGNHPIYDIYDRSLFGPMKADIFRYCLLFERGGFYFDINKSCSIQISKIVGREDKALLTCGKNQHGFETVSEAVKKLKHPDKSFVQWGFGFVAGHPILGDMLNGICESAPKYEDKNFPRAKLAILELTGPLMFTKVVHEYVSSQKEIEFAETEIDFDGFGIFGVPGSEVRYVKYPGYEKNKNCPIMRSKG